MALLANMHSNRRKHYNTENINLLLNTSVIFNHQASLKHFKAIECKCMTISPKFQRVVQTCLRLYTRDRYKLEVHVLAKEWKGG